MNQATKIMIASAILIASQQVFCAINPIDQKQNEDLRLKRYAELHDIKLPKRSNWPRATKYFLSDDINLARESHFYKLWWETKYLLELPEQNVVIKLWHAKYESNPNYKEEKKLTPRQFVNNIFCDKYELILYYNGIPLKLIDSFRSFSSFSGLVIRLNANAAYSPTTKKLYYFENISRDFNVYSWDINQETIQKLFAQRFVKLSPNYTFKTDYSGASTCLTKNNGFAFINRWWPNYYKKFYLDADFFNIISKRFYSLLTTDDAPYFLTFNHIPQEFSLATSGRWRIRDFSVTVDGKKFETYKHLEHFYALKGKIWSDRDIINKIYSTLIFDALKSKIKGQKLPDKTELEKQLTFKISQFCLKNHISLNSFFTKQLKPIYKDKFSKNILIKSHIKHKSNSEVYFDSLQSSYGSFSSKLFSAETIKKMRLKNNLQRYINLIFKQENFKCNYLINEWVKKNHREYDKLTVSDEEIRKFYDDYKWFFERKTLSKEFYSPKEVRDFIATEIKRFKYYRLDNLLNAPPKVKIEQ